MRVVAIAGYVGSLAAVLLVAFVAKVEWRRVFGHAPRRSELPLALVVIPTLLLTYAAALASYIALSWVAPRFVERTLLAPDTLADVRSFGAWLLLFIVGVVAAPLLEEMLFRGLLLQRWAHRWGTTTGVIASSALFAVLHQEWIGHFLVGVALCVLYLRTRSLWMPIAAHAINNGIAILGALPGALAHRVDPPESLATLRGQAWAIAPLLAAGLVTGWLYLQRFFPEGLGPVMKGAVPYGVTSK